MIVREEDKEKMHLAGIYQIKNLVTGKMYVGSSKKLSRRISTHRYQLKSKTHINARLQHSYDKYGVEVFEISILEIVENLEVLYLREQHWLDMLRCFEQGIGYNLSSLAAKVSMSAEGRKRVSEASRGKVISPEHMEKLRIANTGKKRPDWVKEKIVNTTKGRKKSPEHINNIKLTHVGMKGQTHGDSTKSKMSEARKLYWANKKLQST